MADSAADLLNGEPSSTRADASVHESSVPLLRGPFPPSYTDFATNWGYGRTLGRS